MITQAYSKEGLWIPYLIQENYESLAASGFKLTPQDIYAINKASLSDAVVIFGRGCSGAVVSDQGLLFTNYHCGFGQVQKHSSVDNNYLKDGFWAKNPDEELPNPGLSVKFLISIQEFTSEVLENVDKSLTYDKQLPLIEELISNMEKAIEDTSDYLASIESFYGGNEYYLFLYNEFTDIRLVGAPPESLGAYGGDTDNWVWPRHTADFSVFRIYSDSNGKPAVFSEENVPYKPKNKFKVSARGVSPGDFTMVMGYPGRTDEYLYSSELELIDEFIFPDRIKLRSGRLKIIEEARHKNQDIYIKYAVKQSRIANGWKKWKGVLYGFNRFNVIQKRKEYENWLLLNAGKYKSQLSDLYEIYDDVYLGLKPYKIATGYFQEAAFVLEPFSLVEKTIMTLNKSSSEIEQKQIEYLRNAAVGHFKNYDFNLDKKLTQFILSSLIMDIDESLVPDAISQFKEKEGLKEFVSEMYEESIFTDLKRFQNAINKLEKGKTKIIYEDVLFKLITDFAHIYQEQLIEDFEYYNSQINNLNKQYISLIQKIDTGRGFYPDANFTMRVSYGEVNGYSPSDAVNYHCQTFLKGMIEKNVTGEPEFELPESMIKLHETKDYGKYADGSGRLPLCFLASNHTSGGSSGSPVMDAYGRLVGLNFDRTWESTMSDYNFDEKICRNISVDMRYILFIIDKFAQAGYLLDEMDIVW
jgi:hypothetical protein